MLKQTLTAKYFVFIEFVFAFIFIFIFIFSSSFAKTENRDFLKKTTKDFCNLIKSSDELEKNSSFKRFEINQNNFSAEHKTKNLKIKSNYYFHKNRLVRLTSTFYNFENKPLLQAKMDSNCKIIRVREIVYDNENKAQKILTLNKLFDKTISVDLLNPKFISKDVENNIKDKVLIALVDTGVNYNIDEFKSHLAIDKNNQLLGYDFWDNDSLPFDSDPRQNPFYPRHHGSTIFSILKSEAPNSKIVVYRFPAIDMCNFSNLLKNIKKHSIRLVNLSMGSNNLDDWTCFKSTLEKFPDILVFVSAGNDSKNIDKVPVYPASLDLTNILVVTSSDKTGRLGSGSNFGVKNVDFILPAEQIEVIDHRGIKSTTGGTSYAVPRLLSMAARYLEKNPEAKTSDIINILIDRAIPKGKEYSKYGWIPDPTDNFGLN